MLDWHSCKMCYPLEIKVLLLLATNQRVVAREAGNNECWLLYDERCFFKKFYSVLFCFASTKTEKKCVTGSHGF